MKDGGAPSGVEARDIYAGVADVIVCDGFTSNVVLKTSESLVDMVETRLGQELSSTFSASVGYLLSRRAFRRFRRRVDYSEYGGAPLLGVNGVVVVGHGRSSAKAVRNAILLGDRERRGRLAASARTRRGRDNGERIVIAFVFPGQGSQKVGMGQALASTFAECREVFAEADAALGESLSHLCFAGPESDLQLTENTQPAILTASIAAFRLLERRGIRPSFVAGHSLGEYSAHVAAGTFSFVDAVRIVRRRGRYMQEAVPLAPARWRPCSGSTARSRPGLRRGRQGDVVSPANLNAPGQVVIAGSTAAVARAGERARRLAPGASCRCP